MTADTPAGRILSKLGRVRKSGRGWSARCPAHEDKEPSLSVSVGEDGRVLLFCHAGCAVDSILTALGVAASDLFADDDHRDRPVEVAAYDYTDEDGNVLYQVVKYAPKAFKQRRPDGSGGWTWKLGDTPRALYRLPTVLAAARAGARVYVVEGERDVHAIERAGEVATTNPGGAGKWRTDYARALKGAEVIVVADKDAAGYKHAAEVARSLDGIASSVVVMEAAEGKDAADHLAAGRDLSELVPASDVGVVIYHDDDLGTGSHIRTVRASEVRPEPVRWLWPDRIAAGMLNVLAGPAGSGKSTILYDLAARVSREGRSVLVATAEDHLSAVVRPRLEAAGADLDRVHIVLGVDDRGLLLPQDDQRLEAAAMAADAALITVDPMVCFIGQGVDTHKDASVRQALAPLARIAEATGAALVVVIHTNKAPSDDPLFRISGSGAFAAAARHVLLAAADPDDEDGARRVLAVVKSNLAAFPPPLAYTITGAVILGDEGEIHTSRVSWGAEIDPRSRPSFAPPRPRRRRVPSCGG